MQVLKDSNGQKLTLGVELHEGGEGRLFEVRQQPDLVAKIYKHPKGRRDKLEAMLRKPPEDKATPGHVSIVWPIDLLNSADSSRAFVGFVMKRIGNSAPFHEFSRTSTRKQKHPGFNFKYLHTAASNLAGVFAALHQRGYVVGDVNESNILINDAALVTIVDTDSFQVPVLNKSGVYRCPVGRAEFTPPELQSLDFAKVDRKVYHDLFGVGVLIFQLLMLGYHPYEGSSAPTFSVDDWPPGKRISQGNFPFGREKKPIKPGPGFPSLSMLDPGVQNLFLRCFEDGRKDPLRRPSALDWKKSLNNAIKKLVVCQKVPLHYFGNHLKVCPWCEREKDKSTLDPFSLPFDIGAQTKLPSSASLIGQMQIEAEKHRLAMERQRLEEERRREAERLRIQQELERIEEERRRKAEIKPGRWRIVPDNPVSDMIRGFLNGITEVELETSGRFRGTTEITIMGLIKSTINVVGNWGYDYNQKVLTFQGTQTAFVYGISQSEQFYERYTIKSGGTGKYLANNSQGFQVSIYRL